MHQEKSVQPARFIKSVMLGDAAAKISRLLSPRQATKKGPLSLSATLWEISYAYLMLACSDRLFFTGLCVIADLCRCFFGLPVLTFEHLIQHLSNPLEEDIACVSRLLGYLSG